MEKKSLERWYFTFGRNHKNKDCFIVFVGNYEEAREKMIYSYGKNWSFQYSEKDWIIDGISQERMFNLKRIE